MRKMLLQFLPVVVLCEVMVGVQLNKELRAAPQATEVGVATTRPSDLKQTICPTDLSSLQPSMEKALQFIKSSAFRNAMLTSLRASIPDAIAKADGLPRQITFLKREILRQERERAHAEKVAREGLKDSSQPLKPCRRGQESSYCEAMDQYLISTAANLANHAFLEALECYQEQGVR